MPSANNRQPKTQKAFTLIELLVVIAIIGILAGMVVVNMSGATERARVAKSQVFSSSVNNSLLMNRVSEWKFEEGFGVNAVDTIGTNNGILTSGPIWKTGDCVSGSCLNLDGSNDHVLVATSTSLDLPIFTVSVWWDGKSHTTWSGPIQNRAAGQNGFQFVDDQSNVSLFRPHLVIWNGTLETAQYKGATTYNIPFSGWKNFVWIYNGGAARLFIDGKEEAVTVSAVSNYPVSGIMIGRGYGFVGGSIDEVRVYNAALAASVIRGQYLAGLDQLLAGGQITQEEYQQRLSELNSNYAAK